PDAPQLRTSRLAPVARLLELVAPGLARSAPVLLAVFLTAGVAAEHVAQHVEDAVPFPGDAHLLLSGELAGKRRIGEASVGGPHDVLPDRGGNAASGERLGRRIVVVSHPHPANE